MQDVYRFLVDELADERFAYLFAHVWTHHKSDIVAFAKQSGGISPEVEVLYHAKGSRLVGY